MFTDLYQLKDVKNNNTILAILWGIGLLTGCQGEPPYAPQQRAVIELPTEFSKPLQLAFQDNPKLTAQRFLNAHDGFAQYGPVTKVSLKDHARLHASTEQAKILSDIMTVDLNGDRRITRAEYDVLKGLPNGYKKSARLTGLFQHDENHDGHISAAEAIGVAEFLNEVRPKNGMRPLESYLILFDLDNDGQVLRAEVVKALGIHLPETNKPNLALRGKQVLP